MNIRRKMTKQKTISPQLKEDLESLAQTLSTETGSKIIGRKPTTYENRLTSKADLVILFDEEFRLGLLHSQREELEAFTNSASEVERYLHIVKAVQDFREKHNDQISQFNYDHAKIDGYFCQESYDSDGRVLHFVLNDGKQICIGYVGHNKDERAMASGRVL